jgi:hypothetical protein
MRRKYELLHMVEDQKIVDYFSKLTTLVNLMKDYGEAMIGQRVVEKIMRTLTSKFDFIVVVIDE